MAGSNEHITCCPNTEVIIVATQDSTTHRQSPTSPSSQTSFRTLDGEAICRICLDQGTEPLVSPCKCAGSAKFAHESCLLRWFFKTRRRRCEVCLSEVNVKSVGFKPLQKWRLPMDSCDFVFYLFTLYCVIMLVFAGMIIWIATQGCISPVCITLYVICSMSLVYFIYCCGCVEYSKTYWKACVTTNKNWRIYNREESSRAKVVAKRVRSTESETAASRTSEPCAEQCAISIEPPLESAHSVSVDEWASCAESETDICDKDKYEFNLSRRTESMPQTENTRQIEVVSPMPSTPLCSSPGASVRALADTGSMSLLMEMNYPMQNTVCASPTIWRPGKDEMSDDGTDDFDCVCTSQGEFVEGRDDKSKDRGLRGKGDGLTNVGFDTKL